MNTASVTGNLGRDPEIRTIPSGKTVAEMNIGVSEGRDKTCWLKVVGWEKTAEIMATFRKGDGIMAQGRLSMDEWVDRDTNKKRTMIKLVAFEVKKLAPRSANPDQPPAEDFSQGGSHPGAPQDDGDEIPF